MVLSSLIVENLKQFLGYTGFANCTFGHVLMILIGLVFVYLAIKKEWEPMLWFQLDLVS